MRRGRRDTGEAGQATVGGTGEAGQATVGDTGEAGQATVGDTGEAGQATVELVGLLPLLLAVALMAAALLAGHAAGEHAGQAAQAGAMALIQGTDPRVAARTALPQGLRSRATIEIDRRRVTVRVRPRLPIAPLAAAMTAQETADAGPEPSP